MSEYQHSKIKQWLTVLIFFTVALVALGFFIKSVAVLIQSVFFIDRGYFIFERGNYLLLGIGVGALILVYAFAYFGKFFLVSIFNQQWI